jgi:AcrR family transcriptional regulator
MATRRVHPAAPARRAARPAPGPTREVACDADDPTTPRQPRQERGERRVCALLDAAATLIAELGAEGLTVQALADRARTSKGSLYHFFPDLPSVLRALGERHARAIAELTDAMIADPTIDWAALSVEDAVRHFMAPLAYLASHPDLLALARTPVSASKGTRRLAPIRKLADHLLQRRYPALPPRRRGTCASTMVAVMDGVVGFSLRSSEAEARGMMAELKQVLGAYLHALEQRGVSASFPRARS